ncbi:MAG TPA: hypothetical protein VFW68_12735 [Rhodocyclaceae bacterium]|nr:hypothetical protein [Rhodocyclaceae bacterium]
MRAPDLGRLGIPGVAGLGLLLFCLSFYAGNVAPLDDDLAKQKTEEARLTAALRDASRSPTSATTRPVEAIQPLGLQDAPALLLALSAAADNHSVSIERASYRITEQEGVRRLEVSLPVRGNYPSLRAYLRDVLSHPPVVLEEVSLKRPSATDPLLDAQLRLSYPLAANS